MNFAQSCGGLGISLNYGWQFYSLATLTLNKVFHFHIRKKTFFSCMSQREHTVLARNFQGIKFLWKASESHEFTIIFLTMRPAIDVQSREIKNFTD